MKIFGRLNKSIRKKSITGTDSSNALTSANALIEVSPLDSLPETKRSTTTTTTTRTAAHSRVNSITTGVLAQSKRADGDRTFVFDLPPTAAAAAPPSLHATTTDDSAAAEPTILTSGPTSIVVAADAGGGDATTANVVHYELRMPLNALLPIKYPDGAGPTCAATRRSKYQFLATESDYTTVVPTRLERLLTPCYMCWCAADYPQRNGGSGSASAAGAGAAGAAIADSTIDDDYYTLLARFRFRRWWKRRQHALQTQIARDEYDPRMKHKRMFLLKDVFFKGIHLERRSMWLNARQTQLLFLYFTLLDYDDDGLWDDVTFAMFMRTCTNVSTIRTTQLFELLDKGAKNMINFEEWYFVMCCLLASHDASEKEFMLKHSRMVFELLDEDLSGTISAREFTTVGWLFNLRHRETTKLFKEFDLSGDQELDFEEFQFFAQAALDMA